MIATETKDFKKFISLNTGYFANEKRHTKVHLVDENFKPICGTHIKDDMKFQWNASSAILHFVECEKCLTKFKNL